MPRAKKATPAVDTDALHDAVLAAETVSTPTEAAPVKKYPAEKMSLINMFAAALLGSADLHRVLEQPDVFESRIGRVFDTAIKAAEHSINLSQEEV
ncbi:MAG: hypothetical protein [Caudoviricetes sp.]|nr:MAG: hypothetical protein [Caudoviricetes sp.]